MPDSRQRSSQAAMYEIKVRGRLDESWSDWFSELAICSAETDDETTTLKGRVVDQPALRGILTRLWDLNFEIVYLQKMPSSSKGKETHE